MRGQRTSPCPRVRIHWHPARNRSRLARRYRARAGHQISRARFMMQPKKPAACVCARSDRAAAESRAISQVLKFGGADQRDEVIGQEVTPTTAADNLCAQVPRGRCRHPAARRDAVQESDSRRWCRKSIERTAAAHGSKWPEASVTHPTSVRCGRPCRSAADGLPYPIPLFGSSVAYETRLLEYQVVGRHAGRAETRSHVSRQRVEVKRSTGRRLAAVMKLVGGNETQRRRSHPCSHQRGRCEAI